MTKSIISILILLSIVYAHQNYTNGSFNYTDLIPPMKRINITNMTNTPQMMPPIQNISQTNQTEEYEIDYENFQNNKTAQGHRQCPWSKLDFNAKLYIIGFIAFLIIMGRQYYQYKQRIQQQNQSQQVQSIQLQTQPVNVSQENIGQYVELPSLNNLNLVQKPNPQQFIAHQQPVNMQIYPQLQVVQPTFGIVQIPKYNKQQ